MNRRNALMLEIAPWMDLVIFQEWIATFGIQYTAGVLTEDPTKRVLWLETYNETIFTAIPEGEVITILANFEMYLDTGLDEMRINHLNYLENWETRHLWYMHRTGKYDPEPTEETT